MARGAAGGSDTIGVKRHDIMPNGLKTALLLGLLSGVLMLIGELVGGANGLVFFFFIAVVMNFVSYWFSDKIVLTNVQREGSGAGASAPPDGGPPRAARRPADAACLHHSGPSPNAFATGRNPSHASVAATEGILQALSEQELEGVMAHELAHVKHRDILISSVAATIAAAIMMASRSLMFFGGRSDDDEGSNPIAMLAMIILAPIAAMLIQAAISRSREFSADAGGAAIAGSPHGLANALRKIDAIAHRVPLHANPATSHMFIVMPLSGRGLLSHVQHASPDRAARRRAHGRNGALTLPRHTRTLRHTSSRPSGSAGGADDCPRASSYVQPDNQLADCCNAATPDRPTVSAGATFAEGPRGSGGQRGRPRYPAESSG